MLISVINSILLSYGFRLITETSDSKFSSDYASQSTDRRFFTLPFNHFDFETLITHQSSIITSDLEMKVTSSLDAD